MREIRSSGSVEGVMSNHDSYSDFLLVCVRWMRYTLAQRGCRRDRLPRRLKGSGEGDHSYVWGKESTPRRGANSGSRKGERASAGRWCLERGTLNADRRI